MNRNRGLMPDAKETVLEADESHGALRLDPRIQESIGNALQRHYDDVARMPLPDSILVLLAELTAKERSKK